ncbi:MAG TPA: IS607 family element RNA-guided endonuclease TnpB [Trebonia sp.]
MVKLAYRFALDPSPAQARALRSHAGAARFAWNWGLHQCRQRYAAERRWYSAADLHKRWNAAKRADPALGWWAENSKCVYQESFRNLDRALADFVKSRKGLRKGKKLGFPRFKKRGKAKDSFRLTGTIRCQGSTAQLPRLGTIATCEPTTKLAGRVAAGTARILSATVSRTAQRWHVSFTVEEDRDIPARHARPGTAIGIDLGIKTLITGADNTGNVIAVPGPRPLKAALRRLRRASRACSRKQPGSARRRRSTARLARVHARVAAVRADALHKAATMLAERYETVVAEDLNVAGMTRNRRLARAVGDQGFGTLRRMLAYKTRWRGGTLVTADRFFPSSKKCSGCGAVKAKLPLAERVYSCDGCGLVEDRDVNAARNLLSLAASGAERLNARGAAVRPGPAGHAALKREPGTRKQRGKTGTAARQQAAAARALTSTQPQRIGVTLPPGGA